MDNLQSVLIGILIGVLISITVDIFNLHRIKHRVIVSTRADSEHHLRYLIEPFGIKPALILPATSNLPVRFCFEANRMDLFHVIELPFVTSIALDRKAHI
jgi:hypothetical protein